MSNAMRFGKRSLAGVAAGALALGMLTIASAPAASAKPNVKPKTVTALTAGTYVTAALAYRAPSHGGTLGTTGPTTMNLLSITADDTFAASGSQSVLSIRLDSAPADDTGTGFVAIQLSDDTANPRRASALVFDAAGGQLGTASTLNVGIPADYLWTRTSVITVANTNPLATSFVLRGTAPKAGTYGYTAWVNNSATDNLNSLQPDEPYTTGTITVGGTPTAFAITPASASVGANQAATFNVTATDSAGRRTFPTGGAPANGQFANVISTTGGVSFTNSTPSTATPANTTSLGLEQFVNYTSTPTATSIPQGTARFTASSPTAGTYAITVTPGGTLPGTVTSAAATLTVSAVQGMFSTLVTAPATATTSATTFAAPSTLPSTTNSTVNIYVPTSAPAVTFRLTAVASSTAGQLLPYSVTNDPANAPGSGVTSGSFTSAIDANLRASVTITATDPVVGTKYTVAIPGSGGNVTTYQVNYAGPVLNILNLTTNPPRGSVSYVQTATARAIEATVTDQFRQPLPNITVTSAPSVSAAASAITDAAGKATISIGAPAATVTSQTVTFTLTSLGTTTASSSALTLLYTASGSPSSLTLSSNAGNVTATAAATQNVDVSGANVATWAANGDSGWFPVSAAIGGAVANVPVTFSAPDTYFASGAGATSLTAATVRQGTSAALGITSGGSGVAQVWVKPTKTGTVTVTATAGGLTQTITWKVANAAADARVIAVTPAKQDAAGLAQVTATVKDAFGNAVANALLNFSEDGVGNFLAGTSTLSTATGPTGAVTVDVLSTTSGDSKVTVVGGATANYAGLANSPITGAPAGVASGVAEIKFSGGSVAKSITITGARTTVSGKPGIEVLGSTTGLAEGKTVIPYVRFPGGEYTQGSARPAISKAGEFEWSRKTGKKAYVYFTNDDGAVSSNRIIIAAS